MTEERNSDPQHRLDPSQMKFTRSVRGSLILHLDGEEYQDLNIRRAFPLESDERFIGFFLSDGPELGMLEDMADLDEESRQELQNELDKIYFRPKVTNFGKITEEHGMLRSEIETTSGPRQIEIRGWRKNVRILSGNRAIILDVYGNRYLVEDWRELPKRTKEILGL